MTRTPQQHYKYNCQRVSRRKHPLPTQAKACLPRIALGYFQYTSYQPPPARIVLAASAANNKPIDNIQPRHMRLSFAIGNSTFIRPEAQQTSENAVARCAETGSWHLNKYARRGGIA